MELVVSDGLTVELIVALVTGAGAELADESQAAVEFFIAKTANTARIKKTGSSHLRFG